MLPGTHSINTAVIKMLERNVELVDMISAQWLWVIIHIPSQLQGSVLYGDCTDLQGLAKYLKLGEVIT
jgi:hypothetical protein